MMARKRDTRPLTAVVVVDDTDPRTEADLTPEQAETAYRALGQVLHILAESRRERLEAEAREQAA